MTPNDYLRRLEKALKPLPRTERRRIVDEMASHLAERGDAAIDALGPADTLAASFVEDYQAARRSVLGQGAGVAAIKAIAGLVLAVALWLIGLILYAIGATTGYAAVAAFLEPALGDVRWLTGLDPAGAKSMTLSIVTPGSPVPPGKLVEAPEWQVGVVTLAICLIALTLGTLILTFAFRRFVIRPIFDAARAVRMERIHAI